MAKRRRKPASRKPESRVFCRHYSECLDRTVKSLLANVTCASCVRYHIEEPLGGLYWQNQALSCIELLRKVFEPQQSLYRREVR